MTHISQTNPTVIDYHHLDVSRDDEMDEQDIAWCFG
jgi:hypothetical protein